MSNRIHPSQQSENNKNDLYGENHVGETVTPTFTKKGALHSNLNKKLNIDRMGEGKFGGHVERHRFSQATIDEAKKRGLKIDSDELVQMDELELMKQLEIVCTMPVNIDVKRQLRDKLYAQDPDFQESTCRAACYKCKLAGARRSRACKLCCLEFDASITLWKKTFKKIEGHYGSGVLTYFTFLKWLMQLNMMICALVLIFVIIPEAALKPSDFKNSTNGRLVEGCSEMYKLNKTEDWYEHILDFVQGTGFMEKTVVFYGHYSATSLEGQINNYDLKTVYLLVVIAYFVISLIFMVHNTAKGFRERVFMSHNEFRQFSNKVFGGWDYGIDDEKNAVLIHKSLARELESLMKDEKETERRNNRSDAQLCGIWTIRILINLVVLGMLAGAGYLIYFVSVEQAKLINGNKYEKRPIIVQFAIQYMTTVTIALLNGLLPVIFKFIISVEDYSPALEVNITLARTVFLKLASLGVLVSSLYFTITCKDKDVCNVGEKDCTSIRCWETYVGQEFFKLVVLNFLIQLAMTFGYETLRKCITAKSNNKLIKKFGPQEFDIPKNVLDLIYLQTLLWFGTMFCPVLPLMTLFSLYVIFYLKYFSCMKIYVTCSKPYKPSQSSEFFQATLLVCYVICIMPIYILATRMDPSRSCGPYRLEKHMYDVIPEMIDHFPGFFKGILTFITSSAFSTALFVVLVLVIYYIAQVVHTYKGMFAMMKQQLHHESADKQYLLRKLAKLEGREFQSPPTARKRYRANEKKAEEEMDGSSTRINMTPMSRGQSGGHNAPPGVPYDEEPY